jgi:hypothetical protein
MLGYPSNTTRQQQHTRLHNTVNQIAIRHAKKNFVTISEGATPQKYP